ADYWYRRPMLGRLVGLALNTFPFVRTGSAQAVLHSSSQLLRSGWNLLIYPEGTRSPDGRMGRFTPGVGHLANETRSPVVPIHVRGTHRVMPKGRPYFLPAPVEVRFGKPLEARKGEGSRAFTQRVEDAVRNLGQGTAEREVMGSWIDRWRAAAPQNGGGWFQSSPPTPSPPLPGGVPGGVAATAHLRRRLSAAGSAAAGLRRGIDPARERGRAWAGGRPPRGGNGGDASADRSAARRRLRRRRPRVAPLSPAGARP